MPHKPVAIGYNPYAESHQSSVVMWDVWRVYRVLLGVM